MLCRSFPGTTARRYLARHFRIVQRNKMTFPPLDKSKYILSNTYTQFNDKEVPVRFSSWSPIAAFVGVEFDFLKNLHHYTIVCSRKEQIQCPRTC
jgi:hypothetical protein